MWLRRACEFKKSTDYLSVTSSSSTSLLGLGSQTVEYTLCKGGAHWRHIPQKVARKQTRSRVATTASVATTKDIRSYWIGRKVGSKWGISQQHVKLSNKTSSNGRKIGSSCIIMVLLYSTSRGKGSLKYKYDALDSKWIDINSTVSTVTMTYQPSSKLYASDSNDDECLA